MRSLTLVAITHQRTPFALLERVTLDADTARAATLELGGLAAVDEAVVLATCNRTELYLSASIDVTATALDVVAAHTGVPVEQLRDVALVLRDDEAALHLFRVAAGLESRIVGEAEILGQVRAAAARALTDPSAGPRLAALFRWAAATGRRARRGTGGPAAPSLARTALDAVARLDANVDTIVLGAGAMAAAVTNELRARRLPYRVAARRPDRAARLTRRPQDAIALDRLHEHLGAAALVICATSARQPILLRDSLAAARSGGASLTVIDLSMPRNVEPAVGDLDDVTLVHLDQLSGGGGDLHARRATDVVNVEHERYRRWIAGRAAGPVIAALRQRVTAICVTEARRHLPDDEALRLAHRVAGRVLHAPTVALKELSVHGDTRALDAVARALGVADAHDPDGGAPVAAAS